MLDTKVVDLRQIESRESVLRIVKSVPANLSKVNAMMSTPYHGLIPEIKSFKAHVYISTT